MIPRMRAAVRWTRFLPCPALATAALAACEPLPPPAEPTPLPPLTITPDVDQITMRPFQARVVTFQVRDAEGAPAANVDLRFSFAVEDAPAGTDPTAGAHLSTPSARTDTDGRATVQVIAGDLTTKIYFVLAEIQIGEAVFFGQSGVRISNRDFAQLAVRPFVDPGQGALNIATCTLRLLEDCTCADRAAGRLSGCGEPRQYVAAPGEWTKPFPVPADKVHAIVAEGRTSAAQGNTVRATACADVPGPALSRRETAHIEIQLSRQSGALEGAFEMVAFLPAPETAATAVERWSDLARCPQDPASRWLDCSIDALSGDVPGDPNDCNPSAEGALGASLMALRGALPPATPAAPRPCREALDSMGRDSLDKRAAALLPASVRADFARMGAAVAGMFSKDPMRPPIGLRSAMVIAKTSTTNTFRVDHTLNEITLNVEESGRTLSLWSFGLPALTARFASARLEDRLSVSTHGFTLRLGTLARAALQTHVLAPLGSADVGAFVTGRLQSAMNAGGTRSGCQALDELACGAIGQPAGCLAPACQTGVGDLIRGLEGAFSTLDGPALDFEMRTTALQVETSPAGRIDRLSTNSWICKYATEDRTFLARVQGQRAAAN